MLPPQKPFKTRSPVLKEQLERESKMSVAFPCVCAWKRSYINLIQQKLCLSEGVIVRIDGVCEGSQVWVNNECLNKLFYVTLNT